MSRHILAALVTSVVLFTAVTPVNAKSLDKTILSKPTSGDDLPDLRSTSSDPEALARITDVLTPDDETSLSIFIEAVTTGNADNITGLYVPDYGGFYVIQQPSSLDGTVSPVEGVLTQFKRPASGGVVGLLAHNFASGKWFEKFEVGDVFFVISGDGGIKKYRLSEKVRYRAVNGKNTLTDFIDLSSGDLRNVDQVYERVYSGKPHLTLQTCIQQDDDLTWGRLFLLADPVS